MKLNVAVGLPAISPSQHLVALRLLSTDGGAIDVVALDR
jgi:hypothetical protein